MNKFTKKADKKVNSALGVFDKAITAVADAQDILSEGISKDIDTIVDLNRQAKLIEEKIAIVEAEKKDKGDKMLKNSKLIRNLNQFTA